jgi:hypothetical protein
MADRNDELIALANQRAAQQAYEQIQRDYQGNAQCYWNAINEGKTEDAAWCLRNARSLELEAAQILGTAQAQQPQQAQQQQAQQQFTQAEQEWISRNANVVRDPKKWNECLAAANSLIARGYNRDSPEYLNGIEVAIGLRAADGGEGVEIASPDTALEAVNNSQIARKFGPVTPDDYRAGMARLVENKKLGLYEVDR